MDGFQRLQHAKPMDQVSVFFEEQLTPSMIILIVRGVFEIGSDRILSEYARYFDTYVEARFVHAHRVGFQVVTFSAGVSALYAIETIPV